MRYAVTAVAGLAVLVGCGADPPLEQASGDDRAEIERVVHEWYTAFADGDGAAICERTAEKTLEQVGGAESCETQIERLEEEFIDEQRREMKDARVVRAFVRGDEANVELDARTRYTGQMLSRTIGLVELMKFFEDGKVDAFWKREGRADYRAFIAETCRRAGEQDARDDEAAQERIARQVMLEMIRSGRIRDPRE